VKLIMKTAINNPNNKFSCFMLGAKVRNKVKSEARKVKNLRCHLKFNV